MRLALYICLEVRVLSSAHFAYVVSILLKVLCKVTVKLFRI